MLVKELIKKLQNEPQDTEVIFEGHPINAIERWVNPHTQQEWVELTSYSDVEENTQSNSSQIN